MADPSPFKLLNSVDPTKINVPIQKKFAKLTLSSNKKKQQQEEKDARKDCPPVALSNVSRNLLEELNAQTMPEPAAILSANNTKTYEQPLLRSDSSSLLDLHKADEETKIDELDHSEYMEALELSATQASTTIDVEALSAEVSNLAIGVNPQPQLEPPEVSICISSTSDEDDAQNANENDENDDDESSVVSCITISDSSVYEDSRTDIVDASEQQLPAMEDPVPLSGNRLERIEAFLRDVSCERHKLEERGDATLENIHTVLAQADTVSMSMLTDSNDQQDWLSGTQNLLSVSPQLQEPDNSKRLADNDTELNTLASNLTLNETPPVDETNVTLNETPPVNKSGNKTLDDSVTIPETASEDEGTPRKSTPPKFEPMSSSSDDETTIQVKTINIKTKINIQIHMPLSMDSSSTETDELSEQSHRKSSFIELNVDAQAQERLSRSSTGEDNDKTIDKGASVLAFQSPERSILRDGSDSDENKSDKEDEKFLTHAEKLLNQLYGKSWQTPEVIRTLKRSSNSAGKNKSPQSMRTPLTDNRRQPKALIMAGATTRKPAPRKQPEDSMLGNFSLFKRAVHASKLNSTQLPPPPKANKRPAIKHIHAARLHDLIDSESGSDASDDEDAVVTDSSTTEDDIPDEDHLTFLDLTQPNLEPITIRLNRSVESKEPVEEDLETILKRFKNHDRPKMPATPVATKPRRQLFVPNTGFETEEEAVQIVDNALKLDMLDNLELVHLPGTPVHKRVQEVKKQLGLLDQGTLKGASKPLFQTPTKPPTLGRNTCDTLKKKTPGPSKKKNGIDNKKFNFIKSLDANVDRHQCDGEALFYKENFVKNREALAKKLLDLYNTELCKGELDIPLSWSNLLRNTAGRCLNKTRMGKRISQIELSIKVLTSADRLRCTLIHEFCHAAAWTYDAAKGHDAKWKKWTKYAIKKFPDLPPINICHSYDIEYKYTYKCSFCSKSMNCHSRKSKQNLLCIICRQPINVFLNKKDKAGNIIQVPAPEANKFAKFVKENFKNYKTETNTAAEVMKILGQEYKKKNGTT